jgi:hypothetical protein
MRLVSESIPLAPDIFEPSSEFTTPELYDLRDRCAVKKKTRFADKMIRALSSMFKQGVRRGKMERNPCLDMDRAHEADPDANREWYAKEWNFVLERAPLEVLIPMMAARYIGLRRQTIVSLNQEADRGPPGGTDRQGRALCPAQKPKEGEVGVPASDAGDAGLPRRADSPSRRRRDSGARRWITMAERKGNADPG